MLIVENNFYSYPKHLGLYFKSLRHLFYSVRKTNILGQSKSSILFKVSRDFKEGNDLFGAQGIELNFMSDQALKCLIQEIGSMVRCGC
jgi:hypothetical protein